MFLTSSKTNEMQQELIDVVHQLSLMRDTQEIMDLVRHATRKLLQADGVTFVLRDGDYCYYAEEDAISPLWKGKRFPITSCISGWAMLNHQTAIIENIYEDDRIPHDAYRVTFVQSLAMVPVRRKDPIGAIGAYWRKKYKPNLNEVLMLETIANAAAVALTNVGLIHSLHGMMDELQKRNKELDLAHRAKATFLANISHELRTPLNVIIGFSDILNHQMHGPLGNERYTKYATEIQAAGEHLLTMVNDVLDLVAMGNSSFAIQTEPLYLDNVIETATHFVEKKLKDGQLALTNLVSKSLPPVKGDPRLLKQIFFNILANSVKFTPKEGSITIAAKMVKDGIACSITDSGIGMSPEEIELATRPFQQADGRLERCYEGAGIGLALCKGYVDLHGGQLDITSIPKQGTTITVTLPLYESI